MGWTYIGGLILVIGGGVAGLLGYLTEKYKGFDMLITSIVAFVIMCLLGVYFAYVAGLAAKFLWSII